uniref:Conotoxin n=1 Tax=Caenorhabditis tropicalis TaxID=1561998 RepID=A0A1I7UNF5_9PELO
MASFVTFSLLFVFLLVVCVSASSYDSMDKRDDEVMPGFQKSLFQLLDKRPPVVHSRASRIDCMLALRSFELCRNLL